MFPERRKWKRYPLIRGCGWCGLIVMVGLLTAITFENVDRETSIQRAATIQSALEEYRQEKQGYPAALQELVPRYLSAVPAPRVGWSEVRFEYQSKPEKQRPSYRLTYMASPGELVFRPGQVD
jgi:type II secretory pathway pseudopilin PulG